MAEPSYNTFINLFIHPLHHCTQFSYSWILYFIHSPNTQQTSKAAHLYNPNPRPLLLPPVFKRSLKYS